MVVSSIFLLTSLKNTHRFFGEYSLNSVFIQDHLRNDVYSSNTVNCLMVIKFFKFLMNCISNNNNSGLEEKQISVEYENKLF